MILQKLFLLAFSVCSFNAFAQADTVPLSPSLLATSDSIVRQFLQQKNVPGAVYGIVHHGKLIHSFQYGFADLGNKIPASGKSAFRIASMSKSFAGFAILQLRDAGKLRLDDPVHLYIPELQHQTPLRPDAPPITLRHLLTHAAGFPEDNPWGDRQLDIPVNEMLAMFRKGISFSTVTGTSYEYSNMGFAMLGQVIAVVSKMPYQQYINQNILRPLGMNDTYWEYADVPAGRLAKGYRWLNGQWVEQPMLHDGAYGIMGGLITTLEDFARYTAFMLSAWPPSDAPDNGPLKRSSIREMQQPWNFNTLNASYRYPSGRPCPLVSAYGYGLRWSRDCQGRTSVGHSGGLPGFGSNWTILPDYGMGIISFGNLTYAPATLLNTLVLDTLLQLSKLRPHPVPVSPILAERQQQLVKVLPEWSPADTSGIFAGNFFLDYFPDSLRKASGAIFSKAGRIKKVGNMVPENNLRGSFTLEGENADIQVFFTLSPENPPRIQEYHIRLLPR